ncbi:hypothetical protein QG37_06299 [Candidozyma auris]|nr:hypothetical protein QG37_06299 [[Candida] auris]
MIFWNFQCSKRVVGQQTGYILQPSGRTAHRRSLDNLYGAAITASVFATVQVRGYENEF